MFGRFADHPWRRDNSVVPLAVIVGTKFAYNGQSLLEWHASPTIREFWRLPALLL